MVSIDLVCYICTWKFLTYDYTGYFSTFILKHEAKEHYPTPQKRSKINKSHPLQIEILFANLYNLCLFKTVTLGHTCSKYAFIHTVSDVLSTPQQVAQEDCQKEYPMKTRIFF